MTAWVTIEEADEYFATRLGASAHWASGVEKEAALLTAQWQIENSDEFARFPDVSVSGEEATQAMKDAVCEQALFLLQQGDAIDLRSAIIEQGVTRAGIVDETYMDKCKVPISQCARKALKKGGYLKYGLGFRYDSPD